MTESSHTDKHFNLSNEYVDSTGWPYPSRAKEQAYRQGFVEMARSLVNLWPEHVQPAARLRGQQHAVEYLLELIRPENNIDVTDRSRLHGWLKKVEAWNASPIDPEYSNTPPWPLEFPRPDWQQWTQKQAESSNTSHCHVTA